MKTKIARKAGFSGGLRRIALASALVLLGHVATSALAVSGSPVGEWDCISSGGGQSGIAFLDFGSTPGSVPGTYVLTGYELLSTKPKSTSQSARGGGDSRQGTETDTNTPTGGVDVIVNGFTDVAGLWGYDLKSNNIIGYLYFVVQDVDTGALSTNAVSFKGKVSGKAPNQKMSLVASTSFGKVTYKGLPLILVTNASGTDFDGSAWYGVKTQNHQYFQEFFELSDSGLMQNIYFMDGTGPGYSYGTANDVCMISRQNKIGFSVAEDMGSNALLRASIGGFNKKSVTATTKGAIFPFDPDDVIKFDATRY